MVFMRISTKTSVALCLTTLTVLSAYGVFLMTKEERDLHRAAEHDMRTLGTALAVATENAVRDGQLADVNEILETLERLDPEADVFVYDRQGALWANSASEPPEREVPAGFVDEVNRAGAALVRFAGEDSWGRGLLGIPLAQRGQALGTLVLVPACIVAYALLSRFHPTRQFPHDLLCGTRLVATDAKP